jgi:NAD(P)-dependent dehydrogenase (short-subunit alcohol dehydrogenase family)
MQATTSTDHPPLAPETRGTAEGRGRLDGRRILVVGAGQQNYGVEDPPPGNGRAISVLCAREGASLALADVDGAAAEATAAAVRGEGARALALTGDAADEAQAESVVRSATDELAGLDGLVMNVGVARGYRLEGTSAQDWDEAFAINVRSHFLGVKHALPLLSAGGAVVLISSIAALRPVNEIPAYHASKAALSGLCHYAARDASAQGVRVNVVVPGLIDTSLGRLGTKLDPSREDAPVPLGRLGSAWDVAYAVAFLLSGEAAYVTGQSLVVDGGYTSL